MNIYRDNIAAAIISSLRKLIDEEVCNSDQGEMLSEAETTQIRERVISGLAFDARTKLHSEVWIDESIRQAQKLTEQLIQEKAGINEMKEKK